MQELRFVLIIVGALAIAALLFHGLWTSKKEGTAKFGNKPLRKLDVDENENESDASSERSFAPEDDFEIIRKDRKDSEFAAEPIMADPLIDGYSEPKKPVKPETKIEDEPDLDFPSISTKSFDDVEDKPESVVEKPQLDSEETITEITEELQPEPEPEKVAEPEMQVIVLNVHCAVMNHLWARSFLTACNKTVCSMVKWIFSIVTQISLGQAKYSSV